MKRVVHKRAFSASMSDTIIMIGLSAAKTTTASASLPPPNPTDFCQTEDMEEAETGNAMVLCYFVPRLQRLLAIKCLSPCQVEGGRRTGSPEKDVISEMQPDQSAEPKVRCC